MKLSIKILVLSLLAFALLGSACKNNLVPDVPNELAEVITFKMSVDGGASQDIIILGNPLATGNGSLATYSSGNPRPLTFGGGDKNGNLSISVLVGDVGKDITGMYTFDTGSGSGNVNTFAIALNESGNTVTFAVTNGMLEITRAANGGTSTLNISGNFSLTAETPDGNRTITISNGKMEKVPIVSL